MKSISWFRGDLVTLKFYDKFWGPWRALVIVLTKQCFATLKNENIASKQSDSFRDHHKVTFTAMFLLKCSVQHRISINILFPSHDWSTIFWSLIAIFFSGSRTRSAIAKRSQDNRDHEIQWSRSQKRDRNLFSFFFSNQPFAGQIFHKCQSLKNENFEKKAFG